MENYCVQVQFCGELAVANEVDLVDFDHFDDVCNWVGVVILGCVGDYFLEQVLHEFLVDQLVHRVVKQLNYEIYISWLLQFIHQKQYIRVSWRC